LPVYTALEKIPKELIEASLDLGATPWLTFRRVILPLSIPGVVAGSIFTFALSFGDFVTPTLLGGPSGIMISNIIIGQFGAAFDWPFGSALAIVVLLVALATIVVASYFERRQDTGS
jgi:spermidine/putrescine transport system permease protein